jgi:hypothetical protein
MLRGVEVALPLAAPVSPVLGPAFELLAPTADDYATRPIWDAFDWQACATVADAGEWYLVCFRSTRRADADEARLMALDDAAHAEAANAAGFGHYFKGPTNARGECLSFCLWDSRRHARAAAGRPRHAAAATIVHETYASYALEFYRVRKRRGTRAFQFGPW